VGITRPLPVQQLQMAAAGAGGLLGLLMKPLHKYNSLLDRHPLITKSVTSGVMYAAGDVIAQRIEHEQASKAGAASAAASSAGSGAGHAASAAAHGVANKPFSVDWYRTAVFFTFGTFIAGECGCGCRVRAALYFPALAAGVLLCQPAR
jgi:hypothetical protein